MCRVWPALLSALFFNIHLHLFAPLFTGYMGIGDKETFPMAFIAHGLPYFVIPTGPAALGVETLKDCVPVVGCSHRVKGNTMVQSDPSDNILFLHANMQKWYLAVETSYKEHPLRWQAIMPGPDYTIQSFKPLSQRLFGCNSGSSGCSALCACSKLYAVLLDASN